VGTRLHSDTQTFSSPTTPQRLGGAHSRLRVHAWPSGFCAVHVEPLHQALAAHWASLSDWQPVRQPFVVQALRPQSREPPGAQPRLPLQVGAGTNVWSSRQGGGPQVVAGP
jgi:hypothetical protein